MYSSTCLDRPFIEGHLFPLSPIVHRQPSVLVLFLFQTASFSGYHWTGVGQHFYSLTWDVMVFSQEQG